MTASQKEQHKVKRKIEQRFHRQRKKERQIILTPVVTSPVLKSKASEGRVIQRVSKVLPKSPRKQKAVVKKLAMELPPLLSEALKKNIINFYCSDTITSVGPSMKNRHTCRDENNKELKDTSGKTMTLKNRYMCFTINEACKVFCDNIPTVKVSRTSFNNQKPSFIQLRAETPVDTCLYTYHENM